MNAKEEKKIIMSYILMCIIVLALFISGFSHSGDTVGEFVLRDNGTRMTRIGRVWAPQAVVDLSA